MLLNTSTEYLQCIMMTVVIDSKTNNQLPMIYTWTFYFVLFIRLPAAIVPPSLSLSLSLPQCFPFTHLQMLSLFSVVGHITGTSGGREREKERWEEEEKRKRKRERKYKYILKMLRQCVTNTNSVYT